MNKSEIKEFLNDLNQQFEAAFKLFDEPMEGLSPKENLKLISDKYSILKEQVGTYNLKLQKLHRNQKLSNDEVHFLLPAINTIALHCTARKGAMDKVALSSSLYDAQDYCTYYIGEIDV
ncbi:hypothetical protein [Thalassomonas sp. RHCl1]|uniref:hypothetical protein n=1 Tax=Thalassomonas sp. RHCl1 TaxID=2995320 RepID=UPI00248CD7FA|nr:hypothetical protein [Thalassomonas sp. RHCl1]